MAQKNENGGPGAAPVTRSWVIALLTYKFVAFGLIIYVLAKIWPYPTPDLTRPDGDIARAPASAPRDTVRPLDTASAETASAALTSPAKTDTAVVAPVRTALPDTSFLPVWLSCRPDLQRMYRKLDARDYNAIPKCVSMFGKSFAIWDEQRLLWMILLAGALGSQVHAVRSLVDYVGYRRLKWSWVPYYFLLPISGAAIALIFYVVVRGGLFSPNTDVSQTSPFGFTAVAALVGLFSQSAILKLQKIAENVFERPLPGKDHLEDGGTPATKPEITAAQRKAAVAGATEDLVDITGAGFANSSKVEVNGKQRIPVIEGETHLTVTLEAAELAVLDNGGDLRIVVVNGELRSNEWVLS